MGEQKQKEKVPFKVKVKNGALAVKGMWKTPPKGRFLTLKEILSFGGFALGNSMMLSAINYVATAALIPYFYEIDAIHAYVILALATFINMVILPFIGNLIERLNTKIGRYKPVILGAIPIYVIFMILTMWIPQLEKEADRIIYAYLTCTPGLVLANFVNNMYQNMPTVITPNNQERADIMTPIGLIVGFAPTVLNLFAGPIRAAFPEGQEYMAMRIIGIVSAVLGVICILFILKVKERIYELDKNTATEEGKKEEKVTMMEALKMLSKNKPAIIFCIALVLGSLRGFTDQFRWLIIQFRFDEIPARALEISGVPQTIIGFAATVAMFLLPIITRKMNKKTAVILFTFTSILPHIILACVGYENIPVGTTSAVVLTIAYFIACLNPIYLLIPIMLGELADYQQWKTGKRLDGHLQNLLFIVPGLSMNLLMIASYYLQQKIGFEARDYKNITTALDPALQATACEWFDIVAIISAVSGALMIIVMLFYPLSRKKHQQIVEELKSRSVITSDGAVEANVEVSQELTGEPSELEEVVFEEAEKEMEKAENETVDETALNETASETASENALDESEKTDETSEVLEDEKAIEEVDEDSKETKE